MNSSADELEMIELEPTIAEYQLIWENTNDAIFILRNDGAVIQANPALTDILGWHLEEIEGYARPPFFMEDFTPESHQKQLLGHGVGDELLIQFAKRLDRNIRDLDTVGRVGGDEFIVLLKDISKNEIEMIVKRMLLNFNEPYMRYCYVSS